eukprot:scaffold18278_cov100-Isochrysis_galbana.AAC.4
MAMEMQPPKAAMCSAVLPVSVSWASRASGSSDSIESSREMGNSAGSLVPPSPERPSVPPAGVAAAASPMPDRSCCVRTARSASRCSTVCPSKLRAAGSAPCSSSSGNALTTCGVCLAHVCSGVLRAKSSTLHRDARPFHRMSSQRWMRSASAAGAPRGPHDAWIGVRPCTRSWSRASAPCCVRHRTTLTCPSEPAQWRGVSPFGLSTSTCALCASKKLTLSSSPDSAASCSSDEPRSVMPLTSTFGWSRSTASVSKWPLWRASSSAERLWASHRCRPALALSKVCATDGWPDSAANSSGVQPCRFWSDSSARCLTNRETSRSFRRSTAVWSRVLPSTSLGWRGGREEVWRVRSASPCATATSSADRPAGSMTLTSAEAWIRAMATGTERSAASTSIGEPSPLMTSTSAPIWPRDTGGLVQGGRGQRGRRCAGAATRSVSAPRRLAAVRDSTRCGWMARG